MSLVDQTNETIHLDIEARWSGYANFALTTDVDQDSHVWPDQWVWLTFDDNEYEPAYRLTLEGAGLLHDRLGLILGREPLKRGTQRWGTLALVKESGVDPNNVREIGVDATGYDEFVLAVDGKRVFDPDTGRAKTVRRTWPEGYGQRIYDTFMAEGGPR